MRLLSPIARRLTAGLVFIIFLPLLRAADTIEGRWSPDAARRWAQQHPWVAGCNYLPSTAINQLEMWQAPTFAPAVIDRELGWAEKLGFRGMRVFLHDLAWREDPAGFLDRMEQYLAIADRHHIATLFVFFDSCWDPFPHAGLQHAPTPGVHNSGWVQSPGLVLLADDTAHTGLEAYIKTVLQRFRNDQRILGWDLYNEPSNTNERSYGQAEPAAKRDLAMVLLRETFTWARFVAPSQPLTVGVWEGNWDLHETTSPITRFSLENSDVVSYHCYSPPAEMEKDIAILQQLGRPLVCTEYMARPRGSRFDNILPILQRDHIDAFNWGFIQGKSQTLYPWDSWEKPYPGEPPEWFHDVLRTDGTPYRPAEASFLQRTLHSAAP